MIAALTRASEAMVLLADYPASIERARQAIALCEESGIEGALLADAWLQIGTAEHALGRYPSALEAFELAERLAEACGDPPLLVACIGQKGNLLRVVLGVPPAIEAHMRCLIIAEQLGDRLLLGRSHSVLGTDYIYASELDDARSHLELALSIAREDGFEIEEAKALMDIGGIYAMKEMFDAAIESLEHALAITERLGLRRMEATALHFLAITHGRMYDNAMAIHYFERSLDVREEVGDIIGCGQMIIRIAEVHLVDGNLELAEPMLREGVRVVTEGGNRDQQLYGNRKLADAQEELGLFAEALASYKRYMELKAERESLATGRAMARAELMARQRIIEREREVIELKARQLERDMEFKSRELATMTLNLAQQSETIASIRKEVLSMKHAGSAAEVVDLLIERLRQYDNAQQGWDSVEQQFQSIHPGFLKKLSELCPKLTPMELKICALLKLNISSKQIATFLCASVRTVDNHRLHIRQKLELPPDTNLTTYLASL